ncbi:MAG: hypothetical protein KIT72_09640 [Polyangiaceae bacterium]|nr:hypothetical protein [Polyangiaceae bacterium]MCW5790670.1 hypothetical protein [Polyangiaceae bacterium]
MEPRSRNFIYLLVGAACAGVYLELRRHHEAGTLGGPLPSASAAGVAPGASGDEAAPGASARLVGLPGQEGDGGPGAAPGASGAMPNPPPTRVQAETTLRALRDAVRSDLSGPESPWALSHGLIALSSESPAGEHAHTSQAWQRALARIGAKLQRDGARWSFPRGTEVSPGEPHPHSVLATLLDVGVPKDTRLRTPSGEVSLADWLDASLANARPPEKEAEWIDSPWLIALTLHAEGPKAEALRAALRAGALRHLTEATQAIADYQGPPERAFEIGGALHRAKQDKRGIFGHHCGGLHFTEAVLRLYAGDVSARPALHAALDLLMRRVQYERSLYDALARSLAVSPDAGLLIAVQRLKFYGHSAEVLGRARRLELAAPATSRELSTRLDATQALLVSELVRLMPELERVGYARADALRRERPQTYLDLMGDGAHAARGLERWLTAQPE